MTQQNTPDFSELVTNLEKGYKDLAKWRDSQRIQSHDQTVAINEQIDKVIEFMQLTQQLADQMAEAHKLSGVMSKLILKFLFGLVYSLFNFILKGSSTKTISLCKVIRCSS